MLNIQININLKFIMVEHQYSGLKLEVKTVGRGKGQIMH